MVLIERARRYAPLSDHTLHKHVAFVIQKGRVLTWATNLGWRHAEDRALRKVPYDKRKGATMWSLRVAKNGTIRNAKPCEEFCEPMMRSAGISRVYYSNDEGGIEVLVF